MSDTRLFDLANGRELAWTEYGDKAGTPVVAFHGSPGTRHNFALVAEVAAQSGVRLIAPDRPGYGHSTYQRARTFESWASDVAKLCDHLGLDRFAVVGVSSGGPNAVGCARFLGERLLGCAIVSGPAPPEALISTERLLRFNRISQRLTRAAPTLYGLAFQAGLQQAARNPDRALASMIKSLPACDAAVIESAEIRAAMRRDLARPLSPTAGRAAVQDLQLEQRPWGFRLRDIVIPVHVWHGDLDRNVVVESGIYQATEIPGAALHQVPTAGHCLVYTNFGEILDSITT